MVASMDLNETFTKTLKDAALVAIGFGVLGWNKAQVRRRELAAQLETQTADLRTQLAKVADEVEERIEPFVDAVDSRLDQLEGQLPAQAREAFKTARTAAKVAQQSLRSRLVTTSAA
jgi:Tfp pilus assembly protein PilO